MANMFEKMFGTNKNEKKEEEDDVTVGEQLGEFTERLDDDQETVDEEMNKEQE